MYIRRPSIIHIFLSSTWVLTKFSTAFLVKLREKLVSDREYWLLRKYCVHVLVLLKMPRSICFFLYKLRWVHTSIEQVAKHGKLPSEDGQDQNSPSCVLGVIKVLVVKNMYLHAEYIMRNAGLDEVQAGIKIARRNSNNLRYADDTTLRAESEEELKSLLMKVKEESKKVGLKLNVQKTKIMASGPIQIRSVAQSCPTLCNPMNHSTPGLPVHHQLPEFTETHVHQVSDAIRPSHPLSSLSSLATNPSQHQSLFQ